MARTTDFRDFADGLADQIAAHDAFGETRTGDPAELGSLPANDRTTETVADVVSHLVAKLGENIAIRRFARLVPRAGERFASYVHGHGRIGVLVGLQGGDFDLGKDLAMHVAASDPRFALRSEVTDAMLETEREIARAQAAQAGKPANVVERIADGKVAGRRSTTRSSCSSRTRTRLSDRSSSNAAERKCSICASFDSSWEKLRLEPTPDESALLIIGRVPPAPVYARILLKLSGEALMGERPFGIDPDVVARIADEIREVHELGVETAIVVGGGNIIRGLAAAAQGIDRVAGDHMGLLATVINGLAMQDALEKRHVPNRLMSAVEVRQIAEPFIRRRAVRHLEKGRVVLFSGGTGNPFFTTDSAAALRANEIKADVLLKATRVDGVYDANPERDPKANFLRTLSYRDALQSGLQVMDAAAIALCMDNGMPIKVFNLRVRGNIVRVVTGEDIGSLVSGRSEAS